MPEIRHSLYRFEIPQSGIMEVRMKRGCQGTLHYSSLGSGLSVKKAFEQAKGVMMLESPTEANTPMLYIKDGIDADILFIVKPAALDM